MPKGVAIKGIDWSELELEYVQSNQSLKELSVKHNISWGALRSRANRFKWNRRSSVAIIEEAQQKVVQTMAERQLKAIQELEGETVPIARKLQKGVEKTFDDMNGEALEPSELQGLAMALKTANSVARLNLGALDPGQKIDITSNGQELGHASALAMLQSCKLLHAQGKLDMAIDVEALVKEHAESKLEGNA